MLEYSSLSLPRKFPRGPAAPVSRFTALLAALATLTAPALAADGIVKVKSNVAAAEVFIDGQSLGQVPVTRFLPPGSHSMRVVADNYDPLVRKVDVAEGKTSEVNALLAPGDGTAEFEGPPAGRLYIDGTESGLLPIRISELTGGSHSWKVTSAKYEPQEGVLDFVKGKNYLISVPMTSSAGVFLVESTPAGADVQLDGKSVGQTPLRLEGIAAGTHGLVLQFEGRATVVRTVDTSDGSRGELTVSLPKGGSTLKVATGSPSGKVFLNGAPIGEGAVVNFGPVEKGHATVTVEVDGQRVSAGQTLPASGTLMLRRTPDGIERMKPLTQRWGFWAAIGGGAAVGAGAGVVTAVALQPEPLPSGDTVVTLP